MTNLDNAVPLEPIEPNSKFPEADSAALDSAVADIMRELEENPPLKCPISYHWHGNEQLASTASTCIQVQAALMRRRHPWLTFEALDSVIFHHDYAQALLEVSERAGRPCEATSEDSGVGLAMVVHLEDKCVVVLQEGLALGLVAENDEDTRDLCIDTVMHELCHVYDYGRKRKLLSHEFLKRKIIGLERHVFTAAEAAWSEYFANKYSNSALSSTDMHPKYLADVVPDVVQSVSDAIRAYRLHFGLDELLLLSERKVRFLFQCFGYAAGRLDANKTTLDVVAPESCDALRRAGLFDIWETTFCELAQLDSCRDSWTSFDVLKPIMNATDATFKKLGLFYTEVGEKMRVDVPLTPLQHQLP